MASYHRYILIIFILFCFLVRAESPDRFFNGEEFAHYMTSWILENQLEGGLATKQIPPQLLTRLWGGEQFNKTDHSAWESLRVWVEGRNYNSISPDQLFKKAIELEKGNITKALVLCWDYLREDWGLTESRNYTERALKLIDITGDRRDFDGNNAPPKIRRILNHGKSETIRGDNFSAWYHFFGTALYGFVKENENSIIPASLKTKFIIFLEEYALYQPFRDPQKRIVNDLEGAKFGIRLAKNLRDFPSKSEFVKVHGSQHRYLYSDPEMWGPNWRLKEGQLPVDYGTENRSKVRSTSMENILDWYQEHPNENTPVAVAALLDMAESAPSAAQEFALQGLMNGRSGAHRQAIHYFVHNTKSWHSLELIFQRANPKFHPFRSWVKYVLKHSDPKFRILGIRFYKAVATSTFDWFNVARSMLNDSDVSVREVASEVILEVDRFAPRIVPEDRQTVDKATEIARSALCQRGLANLGHTGTVVISGVTITRH